MLNKPFLNIHRFKNYIANSSEDSDIEKIVIFYNKPIGDTVPNFNYRSYKKRGHPDWQSSSNPGNFAFKGTGDFEEKDIANWIVNILVLLTFK
jgi:hypothetical protein